MRLTFELSADQETARLAWYRSGKDPGKFKPSAPGLVPDRIENIANEMRADVSVTVLTARGEPVCGFIANDPQARQVLMLSENWSYK